jgi:ATP:ADP antiporter, AAA family
MTGVLRKVVDVREDEVAALAWAVLSAFCLLCGWFVIRPLRDEMGIAGSVRALPWLMWATFGASLLGVWAYSLAAARVPRRKLVAIVDRFFLANLLLFFVLLQLQAPREWVARAFFVWTTVFNLFVVSVFWSVVSDVFRPEQGRRLFGCVAAGATAGAITGPLLTALLVKWAGTAALLLISATFLELSALCALRLCRWRDRFGKAGGEDDRTQEGALGGSPFAGIRLFLRSPLLLGIGLQTLLYAVTSTFLYMQLMRQVQANVEGSAERTQLFAWIDLSVNVTALVAQSTVTGRVMAAFTIAVALACAPLLSALGFVTVAVVPALAVVVVVYAARRATHFAMERPAREVLFTRVTREERYKSKSFLDTVVYRGGDAISGSVEGGLNAAGLGMGAVSAVALPLTAIWAGVALFLARRHESNLEAAR